VTRAHVPHAKVSPPDDDLLEVSNDVTFAFAEKLLVRFDSEPAQHHLRHPRIIAATHGEYTDLHQLPRHSSLAAYRSVSAVRGSLRVDLD
jgi:hypothetical protein